MLNSFTFGYETNRNLCFRITGTALAVLFTPVFVTLALLLGTMGFIYEKGGDQILCIYCNCLRQLRKKWLKVVIFILLLPLRIAIFTLILALSAALTTLIVGLLIIPYYLIVLISCLYLIYRWCLKSKRSVKAQAAKVRRAQREDWGD